MKARILAALCVALLGLTGCIKGSKNFFYAAGPGTNEVFGFTLHGDGSLTPLGTPNFATGSRPAALAAHPPGDFFYVANSAGNNITLLNINNGNGELSIPPTNSALPPLTPPNIFNAGTTPISMAVAPNAPRLYVANSDSGDISAFLIDPTNGNLGLVSGSPFKIPVTGASTITNPQSLAMSPKGNFLYTANPTQGTVTGFSIGTDGSLTSVGAPLAVGTPGASPTFAVVHPNGNFLYLADPAHNAVLGFAIQSNGTLTPISGSPFAAGAGAVALSITPQGSFLYASNPNENTVSAYAIDATSGALGQISGSPFATGGNAPGFVLATGSFVYVADQATNDIAAFAIGDKGVLTPVKGSPFAVPVSPTWLIAVSEGQ